MNKLIFTITARVAERRRSSRFPILGCKLAFTMAEILISLTIIGVIAAITLPALQANINEKTWATQRKALYSKMSQAISLMGSVNGYGNYSATVDDNTVTVNDDNAAETFITDGLNKVLKITNICDNQNMKKCGIPSTFKQLETGNKKNFPKTLHEFNNRLNISQNPTRHVNTKVAAFVTANGESIALFYNPQCVSKDVDYTDPDSSKRRAFYPYFCLNFVYDLNGLKGPNQVGKDIWFMSTLYSDGLETITFDPTRVSKMLANATSYSYEQAKQYCASIDARIPTLEENMVAGYNMLFSRSLGLGFSRDLLNNKIYVIESTTGQLYNFIGTSVPFRCIYRDKK